MEIEPSRLPKAIWTSTADEFIGPAMIGPSFAFDARASAEEFEVYLEADAGDLLWSRDGYEVRATDGDFEPAYTVLLRHQERTVGFYAGAMLWVDPEHRGKGLSTPLVLASWVLAGEAGPYDRTSPMGFSAAGYAAHEAAHRAAIEAALKAGLPVPEHIASECAPHPAI